jgi:hypothetical protein
MMISSFSITTDHRALTLDDKTDLISISPGPTLSKVDLEVLPNVIVAAVVDSGRTVP